MPYLIAITSIFCSVQMALLSPMQHLTFALGRILAGLNNNEKGRGYQDIITPRIQIFRNSIVPILLILIILLVSLTYAWYHSLWVIMLILGTACIFREIFQLRPMNDKYLSIILGDLEKKRVSLIKKGERNKAEICMDIINQIGKTTSNQLADELRVVRKRRR